MLAERLRDRGYRTAAVVANPWLRGEFGFEQGFDTYVALDCGDLCDGKDVVREALGWLEKNSSSPFFLYLHFNDRLADAHRTKGFLQLFFEWDFQGALRSLERSVELDPSSALSHLWLSFCAWEGREDASLEALRKVQELDPLNLYIISVAAGVLDFWGRTEEAVRECRKALDVDGNYLLALYFIGGSTLGSASTTRLSTPLPKRRLCRAGRRSTWEGSDGLRGGWADATTREPVSTSSRSAPRPSTSLPSIGRSFMPAWVTRTGHSSFSTKRWKNATAGSPFPEWPSSSTCARTPDSKSS